MPWTEITRPQYESRNSSYTRDFIVKEWLVIAPLMPLPRPHGRHRKPEQGDECTSKITSSGGAWRLLPNDFPPF